MRHLLAKFFLVAAILIAIVGGDSEAIGQSNRIAKLHHDDNDVFVVGTIQKIQREPPQCIMAIDEVLVGDGKKLGKSIDIRNLVDTSSTPAVLNPFLKTFAYRQAWDSNRVEVGGRFVVLIVGESPTPSAPYPIRVLDRFRAVAKFKALREKLSAEKTSLQSLAECKSILLSELHEVADNPFWEEYREGAVLHPRVEEMCEALQDLEARTGEKIISAMIDDPKEDIHLRAALISFLETRDYDKGIRRYTDFSRMSVPLMADLRGLTKTSQDASALIVLMHAIYRNPHEQEAPLPHAGELVRESLDPANSSEYRLAFVKRFMHGWNLPHQTRRFDAVMTLLETEVCEAKASKFPPRDTVGDWLIFHMEMAQATHSIKIGGADGYDLGKLHPSARARLELRARGVDPNRQLPPR